MSGPIPGELLVKGKTDKVKLDKTVIPQTKENARGNISKADDKQPFEFKVMSQPLPRVPLERGKMDNARKDTLVIPRIKENAPGKISKAEDNQPIEFKVLSEPVLGALLEQGKVGYAGDDSLSETGRQRESRLIESLRGVAEGWNGRNNEKRNR